ncbi:MAG: PD40 domain-containing protein, partial [Desulfovibrionaceae bacterium]|nr:PD40 domain-containing protein [Desulfovibrionaceae bacterium]
MRGPATPMALDLGRTLALILALTLALASCASTRGAWWDGTSPERGPVAEVVRAAAVVYAALDSRQYLSRLEMSEPLDRAVFPRDLASPVFSWQDRGQGSEAWLIRVAFADRLPVYALVGGPSWVPDRKAWELIKARCLGRRAEVAVFGLDRDLSRVFSVGVVDIEVSPDPVAAQVFFQRIPLPFAEAKKNPGLSSWVLGDPASYSAPRVVMQGLKTCANCHAFSADGRVVGLDLDFKGDKGGYGLAEVGPKVVLGPDEFISWNDFKPLPGVPSMGLFAKISPDGRYVAATIRERPFMFVLDDPWYTQLFFPATGVLAVYDADQGRFFSLPGADFEDLVQTSPAWSPDGRYLAFARAEVREDLLGVMGQRRFVLAAPGTRIFELNQRHLIRFELFRVPFNNGAGGSPEPIAGAGANGRSNYFPRYSPDGKWIVFCQAPTGLVGQPGSELWIVPAEGGRARRMNCNLAEYNSWHSFSPNGRWLVFASKVGTPYTELYLTHLDPDGRDSVPVRLWRFSSRDRAAVIPEFV